VQTLDYDRSAPYYGQHRQAHPEVLRNLLQTSGISRFSKMLEVGCGTGNYVLALRSLVGCECWGIDPSKGMLARAKKRSDDVQLQLGRAENLAFRPDLFSLVFSVDVIHHVEDRRTYFREAHRVLKTGGTVCTVTDSEWIIRNRQPLAVYFPETVEPELHRYPAVSQIQDLMEKAGFSHMTEELVEFPYQLTDIQSYQDRAFSALHLIAEDAFERGISRMVRDLRVGPIPCVSRYTLLWATK
jgi:ubiquinone/menaquinone biosynthesis C-methylase UbiE